MTYANKHQITREQKMKKIIKIAAIGIFAFFIAGYAKADIYGGIDFPQGISSFADSVYMYNPTSGVTGDYLNPDNALGAPDYTGSNYTNSFVSLGDQGSIVLQFTDNSLTTSGNTEKDLWIFEIGGDIEPTSVSISTNAIDWISVGSTTGGKYGIDIDAYINSGVVLGERYSYLKLIDLLPHQSSSPYTGADIDAVGAISSTYPTPIPGAVWLLGSGLAGLIGASRKRKKA